MKIKFRLSCINRFGHCSYKTRQLRQKIRKGIIIQYPVFFTEIYLYFFRLRIDIKFERKIKM